MMIPARIAAIVYETDPSYKALARKDGSLLVELNRALYGHLESARLWFEEVKSTLITEGYVQNPKDQCIFNRI